MRCVHCGCIIETETVQCPNCHEPVATVSVLSPHEREKFAGVTIDQDDPGRKDQAYNDNYRSYRQGQQRVYIRRMSVGSNGKVAAIIGLLIMAVLAVLTIFAVPLVLLALIGGAVIWWLKRLLF